MNRIRPSAALLGAGLLFTGLASCSAHLFSGVPAIDRSRPVALIELRGSPARLGATTSEGVVFLNDAEATGPCRVHYFLGPDLVVDDGTVEKVGGVYHRAAIDLKTQAVPVLTRELVATDQLLAMVLRGRDVEVVDVQLANDAGVEGYALQWPGRPLPAGTGIFTYGSGHLADELTFVGLANGMATLAGDGAPTRYITFTGPARMREALATPRPIFHKREVIHRPDGISVAR
jgi:hypothetical protein